jgi:hypothetical protein
MVEDPVPVEPAPIDPWRLALDAVAEGRADAAADPPLAARIDDALAPFDRSPTDVSGLLREVERRSAIDVDAPLEGVRPGVLQAKAVVRKASSFVVRHLAQQVGVLTAALARVGRDLDERVRSLEQRASLELALDDLPAPAASWAAVLDDLAASAPGPRRDLRHPGEVRSLPVGTAGLVVIDGVADALTADDALAVLARAAEGLAPGGAVAVATTDRAAWAEVADGVVADLVPGRPLQPATWVRLLEHLGAGGVAVHRGTTSHLVTGRFG